MRCCSKRAWICTLTLNPHPPTQFEAQRQGNGLRQNEILTETLKRGGWMGGGGAGAGAGCRNDNQNQGLGSQGATFALIAFRGWNSRRGEEEDEQDEQEEEGQKVLLISNE